MSAESLLKMMLSFIPSTWNIVVSTIVFLLAFWYLQKGLNKSNKPKTAARGIGVIVLAFVLSSVSGWLVDWALLKLGGPQPKPYMQQILEKMIEGAGIDLNDKVLPE
jgi:hypothetical protein